MARNASAEFNAAWLGDCGTAPTLAPALPVTGLCAPAAAAGGRAAARCVAGRELAAGHEVELAADAVCDGRAGRRVVYRGARCGPRGALVQWARFTVGGAAGPTCGRRGAGAAAGAAGRPRRTNGGAGAAPGSDAGGLAVFEDARMVGACGVPPIAHPELAVEVCARGHATTPTGLPRPATPLATEPVAAGDELPWGVPRIEAALGGAVTKPLPVVVGVLDTGVDEGHPDLNVAGGKSWVGSSYNDENGHGTHVAGTIGATNTGAGVVGVAPGTPIFALRVLDGRGAGTFSAIVSALLWVAKNGRAKGIRVVNMSLGGPGGANAANSAICGAVKDVHAAGIAVVAAAGNAGGGYGPDTWTGQLPAACAGVLVVTAVAADNTPATFSYFLSAREAGSDKLKGRTIAAPGVAVKSTWARALGLDYKTISGTSMARCAVRVRVCCVCVCVCVCVVCVCCVCVCFCVCVCVCFCVCVCVPSLFCWRSRDVKLIVRRTALFFLACRIALSLPLCALARKPTVLLPASNSLPSKHPHNTHNPSLCRRAARTSPP